MNTPNPQSPTPSPCVILVRPQMGENIGAVARAMANFGLAELRLVAPRDGWPNQRAVEVSSGAGHIIEAAKLYADFQTASADLHRLYATTARPRDMEKRVVTPREAAAEICITPPPNLPPQGGEGFKVGLVFGPERTGLENSEIALCDTIISIPTSPDFSSLNLAQSVVVVGYEWFQASNERRETSGKKKDALLATGHLPLATKSDWYGLFEQLESYLDEVNYYRVEHKKPVMWQNLQNMLLRGQWSEQEVRTLRGMLRALWERDRRNK